MGDNSFGTLFSFTSFGESHGKAIGCIVDGVPPGLCLSEADIQPYMDRRKPGQSRFVTQRQEADAVEILSGVFEGQTTGTPISLVIQNTDQRSKDYGDIAKKYRPGHADYSYDAKYGHRDYRGGGRSSARETAVRVAAGAIADIALKKILGDSYQLFGSVVQIGPHEIDRENFDIGQIEQNPFSAVTVWRQKIGKAIWMRYEKAAHPQGRFWKLLQPVFPLVWVNPFMASWMQKSPRR